MKLLSVVILLLSVHLTYAHDSVSKVMADYLDMRPTNEAELKSYNFEMQKRLAQFEKKDLLDYFKSEIGPEKYQGLMNELSTTQNESEVYTKYIGDVGNTAQFLGLGQTTYCQGYTYMVAAFSVFVALQVESEAALGLKKAKDGRDTINGLVTSGTNQIAANNALITQLKAKNKGGRNNTQIAQLTQANATIGAQILDLNNQLATIPSDHEIKTAASDRINWISAAGLGQLALCLFN